MKKSNNIKKTYISSKNLGVLSKNIKVNIKKTYNA